MAFEDNDFSEDFMDDEVEDSLKDKYLTFTIAKEGYGIEIRHVLEIIGIQEITALPDMPGFVKGVINLRGKVIPIIDMRLRIHLPEQEYNDRTCIIVVHFGESQFGLIVDAVSEVIDIPVENIDKPPKSEKAKYISGIAKTGDQVKIIVNIEKILTEEQLNELQEAN
ncbi:MAG: chemotaxis protein CheW [Bacteroidota bacterium]